MSGPFVFHSFTESVLSRTFKTGDINNQTKMFNYVIQALETHTNVVMLEQILEYLSDKKTQIVLYTYDAFLFDFSETKQVEDAEHIPFPPTVFRKSEKFNIIINNLQFSFNLML